MATTEKLLKLIKDIEVVLKKKNMKDEIKFLQATKISLELHPNFINVSRCLKAVKSLFEAVGIHLKDEANFINSKYN